MRKLTKTDLLHLTVILAACATILLGIFWPRDTQAGATYHRTHHPVSNYTSLEKYELLLRR